MANSVDPDQTADLGLHCLIQTSCPIRFGIYGSIIIVLARKSDLSETM